MTGSQGNRGEDVKECYFYLDATPSHSLLRFLYKYPQSAFPYGRLIEENSRRSRQDSPYNLWDTGVFDAGRYWDVEVVYAKEDPHAIHARITATNQGPEAATLHLLPTIWFRNTWSWGEQTAEKPRLQMADPGRWSWAVAAHHPGLGEYILKGTQPARCLFTENETNRERLFGVTSASPYVKDGFHRLLVEGEERGVNPELKGTKCAAWHEMECGPGESVSLELVLARQPAGNITAVGNDVIRRRSLEAEKFLDELLPGAGSEERLVFRQAMAGMVWCKQFYNYDVARWLDGDKVPPPEERRGGRNHAWRHLRAEDVISMPDSWEYPWFAAWDQAYQAMVFAHLDVDFAKQQIELLLDWRYLHPNGQIPAYEWAFDDVNPPVHAVAALKVFRAERKQRGRGDLVYLRRVFNKLLMNYTWWLNRKDRDGLNVFEGGFMGLDNISVYDRSRRLPAGYSLKQADATGWMAMFALNMTSMALELAQEDAEYEDMAIQCYQQFLAIANSIAGHSAGSPSLWDPADGFFKDLVTAPEGGCHRIDVYSYVGLIPLLACEIVEPDIISGVPCFRAVLDEHKGGVFEGHTICACPTRTNEHGEHLLSLVDHTMIPAILRRLLSEDEFLSPHGIRSVSKVHARLKSLGDLPGVGRALIDYEPGESTSGLFGGNSNWRGPVWMPINYSILQALTKFHRYLGTGFTVSAPSLGQGELNLRQVADAISERIIGLFRQDGSGRVPSIPHQEPFQGPGWQDLRLFHEYFHGETGQGLGAAHQTGWTGLVANLIKRRCELLAQEKALAEDS